MIDRQLMDIDAKQWQREKIRSREDNREKRKEGWKKELRLVKTFYPRLGMLGRKKDNWIMVRNLF